MSSQSAGRRRSNMRQYSAEDQALNMISKEAESRLAAKRAARAEAREIRLKEIEKQQRESEAKQDRVYELTNEHNVAKNRQLVGSRSGSRRGSTESNESESKDVDLKAELRELEEKYKAAMMTSAQLDNEKQSLVYQVELLKDQLEEQDEGYTEVQRQYKDKCRDFDFQKRDLQSVQHELSILKQQLEIKDRLIEESGFVIVANDRGEPVLTKQSSGSSSNGPLPSGAVLVSQETKDFLEKSEGATLGIKLSGILNNNLDVVDNKTTVEANKTISDPIISEEDNNIDSDQYGLGVVGESNVQLEQSKESSDNVDDLTIEKEVAVFSTDKSGPEMVHDNSKYCVPQTNVTVTNEHGVSVVPIIDGEGDVHSISKMKRSRSFRNLSKGDSEDGDEFYDASDVTPSAWDKMKSFQIDVESSNGAGQKKCDSLDQEAQEIELEGVTDTETCTDISSLHMTGEQCIETKKELDIKKTEELGSPSTNKPEVIVGQENQDGALENYEEIDIEQSRLFTEVSNDSNDITSLESKTDGKKMASLYSSNKIDSIPDNGIDVGDVQQYKAPEGETKILQSELVTEVNNEHVIDNENKRETEKNLEAESEVDRLSEAHEEGISSSQVFAEQIVKQIMDSVVGENSACLETNKGSDSHVASSEATETNRSCEYDAEIRMENYVEKMDELWEFHKEDNDQSIEKNTGETHKEEKKKEHDAHKKLEAKKRDTEAFETKKSEESPQSTEECNLLKTDSSDPILSTPEVNDSQDISSKPSVGENNEEDLRGSDISQEIGDIVVEKEEVESFPAAAVDHNVVSDNFIGNWDSNGSGLNMLDSDVAFEHVGLAEKSARGMVETDDGGGSDGEAMNKSEYDFEDIEKGLDDGQDSNSQDDPINNNFPESGATGENIQEKNKEVLELVKGKQSKPKKGGKLEKLEPKKDVDSSFSFFKGKQSASGEGKSKSQSKKIKSSKGEKKKNQEQDSSELVEPAKEGGESSKAELSKADSEDSLEPKDLEGALDKEMSKSGSAKTHKKSKKKGFFKNVFK